MDTDNMTVEEMEITLNGLYRQVFGGSIEELKLSNPGNNEKTQGSCQPYMGAYHVSEGYKLPEGRSPSGWRGYRPDLWRDLYECCRVTSKDEMETHGCQSQVRRDYRTWESGRMQETLDRLHNSLIRFDGDELKDFKERYPNIIQLVNEFAVIEELREI